MDIFIKTLWKKEDVEDFNCYLMSLENKDKIDFTKRIVNTNMKVLAIKNPVLNTIAKNIFKGDYLSFLNLMPHDTYESTIVDSYVIGLIKDFKLQKKYILKLSKYIDNWATVDSLKFNIKGFEKEYFQFAKDLLNSSKVFERRIGIRILFAFSKTPDYLDNIFILLSTLSNEKEYYVNMAAAWLLCDLFIKYRDKTLEFIKSNKDNKFIINKTISKCRDSYRVSREDKDLLLTYKIM